MSDGPSPNGGNGRDPQTGRFTRGNPGGPGNPHAQRVGKMRSAVLKAITVEDIREIAKMLVSKAKGGDLVAAREILDRLVGKSTPEGLKAPPGPEGGIHPVVIQIVQQTPTDDSAGAHAPDVAHE